MHDGSSFVIILGHQVASDANDTTQMRIARSLLRIFLISGCVINTSAVETLIWWYSTRLPKISVNFLSDFDDC